MPSLLFKCLLIHYPLFFLLIFERREWDFPSSDYSFLSYSGDKSLVLLLMLLQPVLSFLASFYPLLPSSFLSWDWFSTTSIYWLLLLVTPVKYLKHALLLSPAEGEKRREMMIMSWGKIERGRAPGVVRRRESRIKGGLPEWKERRSLVLVEWSSTIFVIDRQTILDYFTTSAWGEEREREREYECIYIHTGTALKGSIMDDPVWILFPSSLEVFYWTIINCCLWIFGGKRRRRVKTKTLRETHDFNGEDVEE